MSNVVEARMLSKWYGQVIGLNNFSIDLLSENLKEIRRDLKDVKSRPPVCHYGGERKSKLPWHEDDVLEN